MKSLYTHPKHHQLYGNVVRQGKARQGKARQGKGSADSFTASMCIHLTTISINDNPREGKKEGKKERKEISNTDSM